MMIKVFLSFFLVLIIRPLAFSQDPERWQAIEFQSDEDYRNQEPIILECSNFVLSVPAEASDPARRSAMGAIVKWMTGTPDYSFTIDESIAKIMNQNEAVLSVYMAALTKNAIEHPDDYKDINKFKLRSFEMMLDYCKNPNNKVEHTKELKKAIKAKDKEQLKGYLGF